MENLNERNVRTVVAEVTEYEIDSSWPVVRDFAGDEYDDSEMDICEVCNARTATVLGERSGVETWLCGFCR